MKIEIYPGVWRDAPDIFAPNLVPFIRAFPSGEKRLQQMQVAVHIYKIACEFIARGGRYLVAVLPNENNTDVRVEMVAAMLSKDDEFTELAKEEWVNGPGLEVAVDRLILASVAKMDAAQ